MIAEGIIDPAKVTRSALQNAASIAALFLTTEAVVADKPEKARPPMGGDPPAAWAAWTSESAPAVTVHQRAAAPQLRRGAVGVRAGFSARRRAELDADPGADRAGGLEDGVLPGALAGAAHHEQVAVADRERDRLAAAARAQRAAARASPSDRIATMVSSVLPRPMVSPCQATLSRPSR